MKRMPVRIPLDDTSQKDYRALTNGDVETNDLGSFPSDHAGFFLAISWESGWPRDDWDGWRWAGPAL